MENKSKYRDIVIKLTRKTAEGELTWRRVSEYQPIFGRKAEAFVTEYNGWQYRLQDAISYANRHRTEDMLEGATSIISGPSYILEVTKGEDDKRIIFPKMRVVDKLAKLVRSNEEDDLEDLQKSLDT